MQAFVKAIVARHISLMFRVKEPFIDKKSNSEHAGHIVDDLVILEYDGNMIMTTNTTYCNLKIFAETENVFFF